jgi:hypothetical protein
MNMGIVQDLMDIIANGYGGSPTGIDRAIATRIVSYFMDRGYASTEEVAYMVKAVGGEIKLSDKLLTEKAPTLQWQRDPVTGDLVLRTIDTDNLVQNAKVNPDAESRIVDSGPVVISTLKEEKNDNSSESGSVLKPRC